jgi:hypothetical protein
MLIDCFGIRGMTYELGEQLYDDTDREKQKNSEKNPSHCHFSTTSYKNRPGCITAITRARNAP